MQTSDGIVCSCMISRKTWCHYIVSPNGTSIKVPEICSRWLFFRDVQGLCVRLMLHWPNSYDALTRSSLVPFAMLALQQCFAQSSRQKVSLENRRGRPSPRRRCFRPTVLTCPCMSFNVTHDSVPIDSPSKADITQFCD